MFKDGSVEVEDEGRGVPVDLHKEEKKPAVEVAFTMLHAGGKFAKSGEGVYHISGGLHGVGVAVSNALSKRCEVTVYRDGQKHSIAFEGGELKSKLKSEKIKEKRTGTMVRIWPDPKYFDSPNIPMGELEHLIRSKAYLLPGLTTVLKIEGKPDQTWKFEKGMAQYFERMLRRPRAGGAAVHRARSTSTRNPPPISPRSRRARARSGPSAGSPRARSSPTATST